MIQKTRYVIGYEIRTKGTTALQEQNEFIYEASCQEFSLRYVKALILEVHGFDPEVHYVVIRFLTALVDERNLHLGLTKTVNQVILGEDGGGI